MADKTGIEWTDATWNPIVGCDVVSPGCTNCYAMKMAARIEAMQPGSHYAGTTMPTKAGALWTGKVALAPDHIITQPLRWKKPRKIFVNSMGDLFHESVPDEWIDRVFAVMALSPQHTFQVLTKRSARMREYVSEVRETWCHHGPPTPGSERIHEAALAITGEEWLPEATPSTWPLPNVWLGVSTEDQRRADERIPDLLATPADVRFVSAEPLLGPIEFRDFLRQPARSRLDLVIVGGESGPGARPMHPDWARSIRNQCGAAGVPFFFKQWGEWVSTYDRDRDDPHWRNVPRAGDWDRKRYLNLAGGQGFHGDKLNLMRRVGKRAAGRLLDGVEHNGMPGDRA